MCKDLTYNEEIRQKEMESSLETLHEKDLKVIIATLNLRLI